MVMLIAGGSLSTGSHDPYCGTLMPLGPSTPSVGVKHESRTNWRFHSIIRRSAKQEYPEVAAGDIFIRKTANSDGLLAGLVIVLLRAAHFCPAERGRHRTGLIFGIRLEN